MLLALLAAVAAQEPADVSYHREVRPLLQAVCAGCHRPGETEGDLDVTSVAALLAGGRSGPSVVPGDPDKSLLVELVTPWDDEPPDMPEDADPLADEQVELLRRWIAAGAVDDSPADTGPRYDAANPPVYPRAPVVTALALSPDGAWLAVGGHHEVLLLPAEAPTSGADASEVAARLVGGAERVEDVAFSPGGTRLAVAGGAPGRAGVLEIWDVATRARTLALSLTDDCLFGPSWSPDGRLVAFGATDRALRAVDVETGEVVLFNAAHEDWVLGTTFSVDGSHLISVSRDRSMKLVKVATEQFIDNITSITPGALKGGLMAVACHPVRDELLVGGADGTPKIYRTYREKKRVIGDDYNLLRALEPLRGRVVDVAWGGEGAWAVAAASAASGGELCAWTAADGARRWHLSTPAGLYALAVSSDGRRVVAGGFDGAVIVVDATSGEQLRRFVPFPLAAGDALSPTELLDPREPHDPGPAPPVGGDS